MFMRMLNGAHCPFRGGGRLEHVRTTYDMVGERPGDPIERAVVLPGGGFVLSPLAWFQFLGGVHQGFSPVAPGAAPQTDPESSWNYELGVRAGQADWRAELIGFYDDYTNLTGQCSLSAGCTTGQIDDQYSAGSVDVHGTESLLSRAWPLPGRVVLETAATHTWTNSFFRSEFSSDFAQFGDVEIGDWLPYVPVHQGALQVAAVHEKGGAALAAHGRTGLRDEASQARIGRMDVPGLVLVDASAHLSVGGGFRLYSTATNLLGRRSPVTWRPAGVRPTAPTRVMLGLKWDARTD